MATGVALSELIKEVQYELGHSVNTAVGQNFRDHIAHRIRREYKRLYEDFYWPHLLTWADLPLVAGTKTYTLPSVGGKPLGLGDVIEVFVKFGDQYSEIRRGIEIDDYNTSDSDGGVAADPVEKWAPRSETEIEVWPLPASAGSLRLKVRKPFVQLNAEGDTCALDDDLVVLFASAELLTRQGSKEAQAVMIRAEQHYKTLRQRLQQGAHKVNLASGGRPVRERVFIGVKGSQP